MEFDEILTQVIELLQRQGRVSYGALKRRFHLDDEYLADLKDELIDAQRVAADEGGKVFVWVGGIEEGEKAKGAKGEKGNDSELRLPPPSGGAPNSQTLDSRRQTPDSVAERRQLTVMFCDLVGSTALSAQLDPEELREVVQAYQETCTRIVERYAGHIAQHLGDGVLVYFGYPVAHEDDAARAVRAGLEIITALQPPSLRYEVPSPVAREHVLSVSEKGQGEGVKINTLHPSRPHLLSQGEKELRKLQVRIGIHTGLVVIGEIGSSEKREILALGETPNLAARIQGQANPDEVMISAATYRLVEGLFECEDRGRPELKGAATPLTLYCVRSESEAHSRFEVVVRKGLTPLIGREHEFGLLCERWERVKDGSGQVVLLSGEPGIGKSRLVEALKETVEREGARCLELHCSPYTQNSAFAPVIEHLQRVLQFRPDDTPDEKLRKLSCAPLQTEAIPLLATLLSLPHPKDFPALTLSPQKQKEKTLEALVAWLGTEAKQHPVVYAWEDLHWADPSTLELLTLFLAQVPTTRLLVVPTFRPEFVPPWGVHSYLSQLTLSRLGRSHVEAMVEKVTGGNTLPAATIQQIVSKTDGVPLFVEELTKSVMEQNVGAYCNTPRLGIPATLQDALMARLDRLGPAKEIAQLGATLGREFTYELLHAVSPLNEDMLQQGLRQLVETELVFQSGVPPQARYLFKHALVQDTAYQSLLKSKRQQYHQQIAQVLEMRFTETKETQPELLAHHYTEAGLVEQALPYWQQAGQRAAQRSASVEAVHHLSQGLELLKRLPDTSQRAQQELRFQIALGPALTITRGYAAPEVESAYTRARELCQQSGETIQLFPVLVGLHRYYQARGELQIARELGEQCLTLAQLAQDPILLVEAHRTMGTTLYFLGEFSPARAHLEQGIARHDPLRYRSLASSYVLDPGVSCLSYLALTFWFLGYPEQAVQRSQEAIAVAHMLSHPFSLGIALVFAALLHQLRQEVRVAQERAETGLALSRVQSSVPSMAQVMTVRGWALSEQGQGEEGIRQIRQGVLTWRATGAEVQVTHLLALLAEVYGKVGQAEEGLNVLSEALSLIHKTGECNYEAELYRLRGELTLAQFGVRSLASEVSQSQILDPKAQHEAEACFLKSIDLARKQQAKSLELRAVMSLVRLRQHQAQNHESRTTQHETRIRLAEAHHMLSEVYNWFTESFDIKDLQEAKTLLGELNR